MATLVTTDEDEGVGVLLLLVGVEVVGVGVLCESGRVCGRRASLSSSCVRCASSSPGRSVTPHTGHHDSPGRGLRPAGGKASGT